VCESTRRYQVVGEAANGEAAWKQLRSTEPSLALIDLTLPGMHPLEVCRRSYESGLPTSIGVMTHRQDRRTHLEILRAHAAGVVLKTDPAEYLLDGLRRMAEGNIYVSGGIDALALFMSEGAPSTYDPVETLSAREHAVFSMLVRGIRPKEIAARLELSPKTVDTYRASLMRKLNIHDVAGLVKYALQRGLTE